MRSPVLTFTALALAASLAACGKSSTQSQQQNAQATASEQPGGPATTSAAEPSEADLKAAAAKLPAPYNTADVEDGKEKFALCSSCHTIAPGGPNMTGPNLHGVVGRKAASLPGYTYSDALKSAGFTWDADHLQQWLEGPMKLVPGTKMTFMGIKDPKDRTEVIAYLMAEGAAKPQ